MVCDITRHGDSHHCLLEQLLDFVSGHRRVLHGPHKGTGLIGHWADGLSAAIVEEAGSGRLVGQHKPLVQTVVGQLQHHLVGVGVVTHAPHLFPPYQQSPHNRLA